MFRVQDIRELIGMISRAWGRERDGPVEKEASIQFTRAEIAKRDKRVLSESCRFGGVVPELRSQGGFRTGLAGDAIIWNSQLSCPQGV